MALLSKFKNSIARRILDLSESLQDRAVNSPIEGVHGRAQICKMIPDGAIGIELGVAGGYFSDVLLRFSKLQRLYSVDAWADHHDSNEYLRCVRRLRKHGNRSVVMRMYFDDAVHLFPDDFFDFVYIDGYAHSGQDDGQTLDQWWPKVKNGGIFSGHDYDPNWPETQQAVDRFCASVERAPNIIHGDTSQHFQDSFDSWLIVK